MKRYSEIAATILLCLVTHPLLARPDSLRKKPNVIFILADDLGWMDTGYNGSTLYQTPHIDSLARMGMVFTQAYSANPLSSPTRASILTGLHPARIGITFPDCHYKEEILQKGLNPQPDSSLKWIEAQSLTRLKTEYITLAEAFQSAGYITGHFGKWHLGKQPYNPNKQGFDIDFPQWSWVPGPSKYLAPWKWGVNGTTDNGKKNEHIEDRTTDEAIRFIREHKDVPFFLNYWAWSVHGPHETKENLLEKYSSKVDPSSEQRHPYYAGMVETLDNNVGKLLRAVRESGLDNHTIIVFLSDNGGIHWPSRQVLPDVPVTSNSPLRGGKATIYDGGTRVPCIVYWPGVTRAGTASDQLISSIDWYPTLLEMAHISPDTIQKPDGISIVPALQGRSLGRNTIYCHFPHGDGLFTQGHQPSTYVREGDWKLIRFYCDNADQTDRFELYNLTTDPGETVDLIHQHPEKVRHLKNLINRFLIETEAVVPIPNPKYHKRLSQKIIPSMATWRMDTTTINFAAKYSPFNVLVNLRSLGRDKDIMEENSIEQIREIVEHGASKGIGLVADLDVRLALPTFEARYPDELQSMIVFKEIKTNTIGTTDVIVPSRTLSDHYHRPYLTRSGKFIKALGYNLTKEGLIEPGSLQDITKHCRVVSATKEGVKLKLPSGGEYPFSYILTMVSFTYLYPDVFAPHLKEFQSDIFRKYADVPLVGAHNDEWGFPAALSGESVLHEYWYSAHMGKAYTWYTQEGRNLMDDILLMYKGIKGKEKERLKAINLFGEFVRNRNGELEEHFYKSVKESFGTGGIVGVHPTWFPYPERREFKKNGLNWWIAKRDWAQTDEVVPFAIRTSLSKKWGSPVWYNMFYRYGLPEGTENAEDYEQEVWSAALAGGRINNLPTHVNMKGLAGSDFIKAETRIRLLNYIQPTPLNCPVAVIFGHAAAMNWVSSTFEDVGMSLVDGLWKLGIAADLIPTSEIENNSIQVDKDGYIRYGEQQYAAVILYNPEFEKPKTSAFFHQAAKGKTQLYRMGDWTMDFNGDDFNGTLTLPVEMSQPYSIDSLLSEIQWLLKKKNIPLHTPATRRITGFGHISHAPPATGFSYLLDGTLVQVAGSKNAAGDTICSTMQLGQHKISVDAVGLAAVRLDEKGDLNALAAGGLKSLKTPAMTLNLDERIDLALWKNDLNDWEGVVQGWDDPIPGPLLALTGNWTYLSLPDPHPAIPKNNPKKVYIDTTLAISGILSIFKETVNDTDGNTYPVIKLGNQIWMGENLRVSKFNDGTPLTPTTGKENTPDKEHKPQIRNHENDFGRLYQWHAVETDKLCPPGWRIPDDKDWEQLIDYLDKSSNTLDKTIFQPKAGGYLHPYGAHINLHHTGIWWSSSGTRKRMVWNQENRVFYLTNDRELPASYGFSVRCIKKQ